MSFHSLIKVDYTQKKVNWKYKKAASSKYSVMLEWTGLLIFCVVAEPRNSQKHVKFARNLTKYMTGQHNWNLSWLLGLFTHRNLEIWSLPRVNNVPKLLGVLGLMLRNWPRCKKLCHWRISRVDCCWKSKWWSLLKRNLVVKQIPSWQVR